MRFRESSFAELLATLVIAVVSGIVFAAGADAQSDREQREYEEWKARQGVAETAADRAQSSSAPSAPRSSPNQGTPVPTELTDPSLVPPPRTIGDIALILEEKQADQAFLMSQREIFSQQPPDSENPNELAEFYLQRARAAEYLGRSDQEIADYRELVKYARRSKIIPLFRALMNSGFAEWRVGNFSRGLANLLEAIDRKEGSKIQLYPFLGILYAQAGDLAAAGDALERASRAKTARWSDRMGAARHNAMLAFIRGLMSTAVGRFDEGERFYRSAVNQWEPYRDFVASDNSTPRGAARLYQLYLTHLVENLRRQGRLIEAEIEIRKALLDSLRIWGRDSARTVHVLRELVTVIFEQGRYKESEVLARASVEILDEIGATPHSVSATETGHRLAGALTAQGRWQEALTEYEAIREAVGDDPYVLKRYLTGNIDWALALLKTRQAEKALNLLEPTLEQKTALLGEKHYDTAEIRGFMAMAYAALGDKRRALDSFQKAATILLARSHRTEGESGTRAARDQRLQLILEAYIGLLSEVRATPLEAGAGIDAAAEAFRMADVARGRSVQRALAASAARAAARNPTLADIARREQDAQKQIAALYVLLANISSRPANEQDPKVIQSLRAKIDQLRTERATLAERIEIEFPDYWNLLNPQPVTVAKARKSLRAGESLIATYVGSDRLFVWALSRDGPLEFASSPTGREDVEAMVAFVRAALAPNAQTLGDIPPFDLKTAHELYRIVLEPVQAGWQGAKSLLVVAHGALGQLPFSLLPSEATQLGAVEGAMFEEYRQIPWLARTHAVAVLPTVASLATLRELPSSAAAKRPFVGFGDPYFSESQATQAAEQAKGQQIAVAETGRLRGLSVRLRSLPDMKGVDSAELARLPRLPDTAEEIRGMALAMNADLTKEVFLGAAANEHQVKTMDLSGYRVIAFATHGLVPGDLNGLTQPALALSAPQVAGVGGDGLLTMGEILGLRLDADWVVLSACNTAAADGIGAEAVSGLGRAFFYAGARALLVSNWPVETTSARALTTDVFERQAADTSLTRAEALRQTMLSLIDGGGYVDAKSGETVFSYAHPIFWAPFALVGDGG